MSAKLVSAGIVKDEESKAPHNFLATLHQRKLTRGIKCLVRPGELLVHIYRTPKKCPRISRCDSTAPVSPEASLRSGVKPVGASAERPISSKSFSNATLGLGS